LVYVVGVPLPHVAIGTSALAVAANAAANVVPHWRGGTIKFRCAFVFAGFGIVGALIGSTIGKAVDGHQLVAWFGVVMVAVGIGMLFRRPSSDKPEVRLNRTSAPVLVPRLAVAALLVGLLSGLFGIGGGFLIVPALMLATGMPMINAVGSSLIAIAALGAATAANYAISGLVDWLLAASLLAGGVVGGFAGVAVARRLAARRRVLTVTFAVAVAAAGVAVSVQNWA
jgi:uncharacterized membrane protein YfcA